MVRTLREARFAVIAECTRKVPAKLNGVGSRLKLVCGNGVGCIASFGMTISTLDSLGFFLR